MPSSPPRRAMCVLQVVPSLEAGGAERATIDIAAALAARGDRALVASEGGRLEAELAEAGAEIFRLPAAAKNPIAMAMNVRRLSRLIRSEKVDLIHARSRAPAWSAYFACRATEIPFVTTFHGSYGEENAAKRLYNSVMVRGDAVIANSRYTAQLIAERYDTLQERIAIIPRGTDLTRFDPAAVNEERRAALRARWGLSAGDRVALNLARLTGWKGQRILIEATAEPPLAEIGNLVVVIAGDAQGRDQYRLELELLAAARGVGDRVRIVGHCSDTPAALSLASVAVIASTEPEAFGRTAIEAAAMGVPVVATALGATAETVLAPPYVKPAERTGWLVRPGDKADLAAAIGEAVRFPTMQRGLLAGRARHQAESFATPAMQSATLAVYDRLLHRTGSGDSFSKR